MLSLRLAHFAAIGAAAGLFLALQFLDRTALLTQSEQLSGARNAKSQPENSAQTSPKVLQFNELPTTSGDLQNALQAINHSATTKDSLIALRKAVSLAVDSSRLDLAAFWQEQILTLEPTTENLYKTATYFKNSLDLFYQDKKLFEGLNAKALVYFELLAAKEPNNVEFQVDLALLYVNDKDRQAQGVMTLKKISDANPKHFRARFELAKLAIYTNQFDKAIEHLLAASAIEPNNWEPYFYLAKVAEHKENKSEALTMYKKSLILAPDRQKEALQRSIDKL